MISEITGSAIALIAKTILTIGAFFAALLWVFKQGRNKERLKNTKEERDSARDAENRYRNRPHNVANLVERLRGKGKRG